MFSLMAEHSTEKIKFDQGMEMNYWQPKYELMAREELEELQLRRSRRRERKDQSKAKYEGEIKALSE